MRTIIWLVLLFAVAVVAALTLGDNDGLASFYWAGWRVDVSLNFFVLAVLGLGFAGFTAVNAVNALLALPTQAREWRGLRRERAAQAALREAQAEFLAARYSRAHKAAQRAGSLCAGVPVLEADTSFERLATLLAAASLHRLQDKPRRDALVKPLLLSGQRPGASAVDDGARLVATEWALDDRDAPRAEALLADMGPGVARRTQALRLKLQSARLSHKPTEALHTARLLANHQAFSAVAGQGLLRSLAIEALDVTHDIEQLRRTWQQFDPADQRDPFVVSRAARRAATLGAADEGRAWLRPLWERLGSLEPDGRAEVALALADACAGIGTDWLPRVEAAQRNHGSEPALQAAAGAVWLERQLWGKARAPLELAARSVGLPSRARRQAWRALAAVALAEGDADRVHACHQAAAEID
jgi:HemY protein